MKLFSDCIGKCWKCSMGNIGCLAGIGDDDFEPATKEQLIERLDHNQFSSHRSEIIGVLKNKFGYDYYQNKKGMR